MYTTFEVITIDQIHYHLKNSQMLFFTETQINPHNFGPHLQYLGAKCVTYFGSKVVCAYVNNDSHIRDPIEYPSDDLMWHKITTKSSPSVIYWSTNFMIRFSFKHHRIHYHSTSLIWGKRLGWLQRWQSELTESLFASKTWRSSSQIITTNIWIVSWPPLMLILL